MINLAPSRAYARVTLFAHGLSLLAILLSTLPFTIKMTLGVLLCASGIVCRIASLRSARIQWQSNDVVSWTWLSDTGQATITHSGLLAAGCYQCSAFVVLCVNRGIASGPNRKHSLLIPRDAVSVADFRALRSRLTLLKLP